MGEYGTHVPEGNANLETRRDGRTREVRLGGSGREVKRSEEKKSEELENVKNGFMIEKMKVEMM